MIILGIVICLAISLSFFWWVKRDLSRGWLEVRKGSLHRHRTGMQKFTRKDDPFNFYANICIRVWPGVAMLVFALMLAFDAIEAAFDDNEPVAGQPNVVEGEILGSENLEDI